MDENKSTKNKLNQFEEFMVRYGRGWVLVNKTDKMASYQQNLPAENGSCLVAFVLLLFFIIPAVLYMIYGRRPARTHQLTVLLEESGNLVSSGDSEGLRIYNKFLTSLNPPTDKVSANPKSALNISTREFVVGGVVLLIIIIVITLVTS